MIKYAAALILVLVPLVWGALMAPFLNSIENLILNNKESADS